MRQNVGGASISGFVRGPKVATLDVVGMSTLPDATSDWNFSGERKIWPSFGTDGGPFKPSFGLSGGVTLSVRTFQYQQNVPRGTLLRFANPKWISSHSLPKSYYEGYFRMPGPSWKMELQAGLYGSLKY
jgi:hypothetical protein